MVAWEKQIEERSVPAWRDKYVNYASLKRKLDRMQEGAKKKDAAESMAKRALYDVGGATSQMELSHCLSQGLLDENLELVESFMQDVDRELERVANWYEQTVEALESRVRSVTAKMDDVAGARGLQPNAEKATAEIETLHLQAVQLTEFVLLNVEGLRKIVKKMDKVNGTSMQKDFVENKLKTSALAMPGAKQPFIGQRARKCRLALEAYISPERLQELRSRALAESYGASSSRVSLRRRRTLLSVAVGGLASLVAGRVLQAAPDTAARAQRCVGLLAFTVAMWISEAAPFEATALLVPPLAVVLSVLEGTRREQAKLVLGTVFSESLYLVLCGFVISSIFSGCQLECRTAAALQRRLGKRPFGFMLAIMMLGLGLSAILSNVTAPLLLVEVLKPMLKDMPTDSRYSRVLLLGLAFSCNIGGMATPISSPQNIASIAILRQYGGDISWSQWLAVSIPFCVVAVVVAWLSLMAFHHFDCSADEKARGTAPVTIPPVAFTGEELGIGKWASLAATCATLVVFACEPLADALGGTGIVAMFFVAMALATGMITRQTFDSYSWHLLFLIGGGSVLGLVVNGSGLLGILTQAAAERLASDPFVLVAQLVLCLVAATTFVSHTVAALVLMPLVVQLGEDAGVRELSVLTCGLACSAACALPMTSFPNVNSLMAVDDQGRHWLAMRHFLLAGTPVTLAITGLLVTYGVWLAELAL